MTQGQTPTRIRFDSFELDFRTGELEKNGQKIRLQEQPAKLLLLLATHPGELVTREEIQKVLWPDGFVVEYEHAINTDMKKIREVLDDDAKQPRFIETLPKKGYRFIGKVEQVSGTVAPEPAPVRNKVKEQEFTLSVSRSAASLLFLVIQAGYLSMYCTALYYWTDVGEALAVAGLEPVRITQPLVLVSAMAGIAVRIYLFSEVAWSHPNGRRQFERLFPLLLVLDAMWAASPLLAGQAISFGIALAGVAGLAYVPFAQRRLIETIYPRT